MIDAEAATQLGLTINRLQPEQGDILLVSASLQSEEVQAELAEAMYLALEMAGLARIPVVVVPTPVDLAIASEDDMRALVEKLLEAIESK